MPSSNPTASIVIREHGGRPFYEAKFRHRGRQVKRRVGPAWLERDHEAGGWRRHRGRVAESAYDERGAHVRAAQLVDEYVTEAAELEHAEHERRAQGPTFREVAHAYLRWLEDVRGAKPSTLVGHRSVLAEQGTPYRRGGGATLGHVMAALGDRPAAKITTREIEDVLTTISETGASPRTVNKHRNVIAAVFSYGCKPSTYALSTNPTKDADRRREPHPGALVFYSPEEVETIARSLMVAIGIAQKRMSTRRTSAARHCTPRIIKTPRSSESPPTRDSGRASCWPCAGTTLTSPGLR